MRLHELLETASFKDFWASTDKEKLSAGVTGFDDAIRNCLYITVVIYNQI